MFFFSGCCISTVLWWNLGFGQWDVVRISVALTLSSIFYISPLMIRMIKEGKGKFFLGNFE